MTRRRPEDGEPSSRHHRENDAAHGSLRPGERILDLGCGSGWATRLLARMVGEGPQGFGQVVGIDISDEMIRQARAASKEFDNVMFVVGIAAQIPWEENFLRKCCRWSRFITIPIRIAHWPSCFA
jgi:ubiquinone/menaquinone biosynthesis C-methylase UbiE